MGEKGNAGLTEGLGTVDIGVADPMSALEALPIDAIKSSPETINAWFDTYLKYREVKELRKANEAAAEAAQAASDAAAIAKSAAATAPGAAHVEPGEDETRPST